MSGSSNPIDFNAPNAKPFAEGPFHCPDQKLFEPLTAFDVLDGFQKRTLKKEGVYYVDIPLSLNRDLYFDASILKPQIVREKVVKMLAVSLFAKEGSNRSHAAENLLVARKNPEVKRVLEEVAKSYSVPAIMERSAQIMTAPELPEGCHLPIPPTPKQHFSKLDLLKHLEYLDSEDYWTECPGPFPIMSWPLPSIR